MKAVVFGSLNVDTIAEVPRRPEWGETMLAGHVEVSPGGKGANQAVALSKLGIPTQMVGCVGNDDGGSYMRRALRAAAVEDAIRVDGTLPTGSAFALRDPSARNLIVVSTGANAAVSATDLYGVDDPGAGTALVLQLETTVTEVKAAAKIGRDCGWRVVLNAAPALDADDELLGLADVLVVNENEAAALTNMDVAGDLDACDAARRLNRLGPELVAITLGAHGAVVVDRSGCWRALAPAMAAVDTTGAGDAFVGALTAALLLGGQAPEALRWGVAAGSLAVGGSGAQQSLPSRAAVETAAESIRPELANNDNQ
jgi:ribokinase